MTDKNTRLFPPYLLWFVLLPALPFLFSISALSFFVDPIQAAHEYVDKTVTLKNSPVAKNLAIDPKCSDKSPENCISGQYFIENIFSGNFTYEENPQKILAHIADLLTYFSVTAVHGIVCLFVIGFILYQTHKMPVTYVRRMYVYMAITSLAFLVVVLIVRQNANELMLTELGYKSICVMLSQADLQTSLVWLDPGGSHAGQACFQSEDTRLVWLAYSPIAFGVLAIIAASAFTTIMASQPIISDEEGSWRDQFLTRIKRLQKSFYLLSLVLVTSTITILLFTSLPIELLDSTNAFTKAFGKFVNGMTAFWGGLFTATLCATFVPAVLLLIRHVRLHQNVASAPSDFGRWLYESVFVSLTDIEQPLTRGNLINLAHILTKEPKDFDLQLV